MSKQYSKKKRINGGNIITRRSNRLALTLPSRKSSNRHRHSLKHPHILHPKVSTTLKPVVSKQLITKPSEKDDFMKTYILYTCSNDKKSREFIGINHPAMQHISVNDYMNLLDNAVSNLSNNLYKSKHEKDNEIRQSNHIWNQVQRLLNGPDIESTTQYKQPQKQKTQKPSLRRHSIGGAARPPPPPVDAPPPPVLPDQVVFSARCAIRLDTRLTFEKLFGFMAMARVSKPANWRNRATIFMKYMFFNEFTCQVVRDTLTGSFPPGQIVTDYVFSISTSSYLRELNKSHNSRMELTRGPPFAFLLGSISGIIERVRLVEVAPILSMSTHDETSTVQFNVSMFKGRFDTMSNVQRRHYIYCIIMFVIMRANDAQLQAIIQEFNEEFGRTYLHLEAVLEITKIFRNGNDSLPYNIFFNRATVQGNSVFPSDISMIFYSRILGMEDASISVPGYHNDSDSRSGNKKFRLPIGYSNRYFEMLRHIYKKIIGTPVIEDVFTFDIQDQIHEPRQTDDKLIITQVRFPDNTDFAFYFTLKNTDDVNFYVQGHDPDVGIIKDGNNEALFYRNKNIPIIGFVPNSWSFQRWISRQPEITDKDIMQIRPLSRKVWTVKSRTTIIRDKIMGYLSHLAYYPNDVIENVSRTFFNKTIRETTFIYVGKFDKDPTYPLSTTDSDTYSRVHVWLKIRSGLDAGGELYVVTRGSKTGYDWDSADSDIQNGILNSQRSLHMVIVLREVIEYLNACLTPRSVQGSLELRGALSQLRGKTIQIYSSGHSLGGYLSLSLSHSAFCTNLINGFSFQYIAGINHASKRRNRNQVISLNSYIIPIVFDPYVVSTPIMNAFSFLPYAHIHSCIDSDFAVDHPRNQVGQVVDIDIEQLHRLYPITQTLRLRYDDVASAFFLAYLRKKHSIQHFYDTMGHFSIFHYKNVYNVFENFIYHDTYYLGGPGKRSIYDGRISHNLSQIIGLVPEYIFSCMFQTKLLIKTPQGLDENQSLQAAHYTFPIPTSKKIVPLISPYTGPTSLLRRSNYIRYDIQDVSSTESSCVSKISYAHGRPHYTVARIYPQSNTNFALECSAIFENDIAEFITSSF